VGVDDPYAAWCFDEAVYLWQMKVNNEMDQAEQAVRASASRTKKEASSDQINRARQGAFEQMMALKPDGSFDTKKTSAPGKFMDPASRVAAGGGG